VSYLLDTNICIPFLNEKDVLGWRTSCGLPSPDEVKLCSVVKAGLLYGARCSRKVEANLAHLDRFFAAFESLPFDDAAAAQYGSLRAQLRRSYTRRRNDMMIAAIAFSTDSTPVTRTEGSGKLRGCGWRSVTAHPNAQLMSIGPGVANDSFKASRATRCRARCARGRPCLRERFEVEGRPSDPPGRRRALTEPPDCMAPSGERLIFAGENDGRRAQVFRA
jgi:tRNA(fMet)-specific endonuclease VapC